MSGVLQGVTHMEHNLDTDAPLRFIQMWITTRQRGLPPKVHLQQIPPSCAAYLLTSLSVLYQYGSFVGDAEARRGRFAHLVADVAATDAASLAAPIRINQVPRTLRVACLSVPARFYRDRGLSVRTGRQHPRGGAGRVGGVWVGGHA